MDARADPSSLGPEEAEFMVSSYELRQTVIEGANILRRGARPRTDNRIAPTGGVLEQSHALLEQARIKLLEARENALAPRGTRKSAG